MTGADAAIAGKLGTIEQTGHNTPGYKPDQEGESEEIPDQLAHGFRHVSNNNAVSGSCLNDMEPGRGSRLSAFFTTTRNPFLSPRQSSNAINMLAVWPTFRMS